MLGDSGSTGQLRLVLQYLTDQASKQQVLQDAQEVQRGMQETWGKPTGDPNAPFGDPELIKIVNGQTQEVTDNLKQAGNQIDQNSQKTENWYGQMRMVTREGQLASQLFSTIGTMAAVSGAAIEVGVWGSAAKYVKDATEANAITDAWKNTTNELNANQDRIGQVMANAVLPQYREFAQIQGMVADFLQAHPDVAADVNMAGELLVGVGAVAKAIGTGIRLVTDIAFITAVQEHNAGMAGFGVSVGMFNSGVDKFGGGMGLAGVASTAGTITLIATSVLIGSELGMALGNSIGRSLFGPLPSGQSGVGAGDIMMAPTLLLQGSITRVLTGLDELGIGAGNTAKKFEDLIMPLDRLIASFLPGSANAQYLINRVSPDASSSSYQISAQQQMQFQQAVVGDYEKYYQQQQADAQNNADAILKIQQEAYSQEQSAAENNAKAIERIDQSYADRVNNIVASAALQDANAEAQYAEQRAQTIRDAGIQIQRAERDLQNKLYDLQVQHNDRLWELGLKRDALGIEKENQAYDQERAKDIRDANQQIARDRQDLAIKLEDQQTSFEREQAQRHAQEQLQLQEAAAQHAQQLADQQQSYDDQIKNIEDNEAKKLKEQQDAYQKQEQALRTSLINQINDEYWALDSEAKMKSEYYQMMLADATKFMQEYSSVLAPGVSTSSSFWGVTGSAAGIHDYTGYAYPGVYAMAQNGLPEFVLSGQATSAAEQIIGGKLTEQALMTRLLTGGGQSAVYNDYRRVSGDVSVPTKRDLERGAIEALGRVLRK